MAGGMRILLVGDHPPPYGGIAIHVQQLHRYLRRRGWEAEVVDIGKGRKPAPNVTPAKGPVSLGWTLGRAFAKGFRPHLHTSGNNPKSWLLASAVAELHRPFGSGAWITLHSGLLPQHLRNSSAMRVLARRALSGYSTVIAVSEAIAQALRRAGVPAARIEVCPAFCESEVLPAEPPTGFARARSRRSPLLAMAYHPGPVYGARTMFECLAQLREKWPDLGLLLFGPESDSPALFAEARAFGVDGLLEPFGVLSHEVALAVMAKCDLFVRPTLADGDAISVREALALGIPCVASDVVARPEGVHRFATGDPGALTAAVSDALVRGPKPTAAPRKDAGPFLVDVYGRP